MTYTVFLSSTFADFERERERLENVLPCIGVHVSLAEREGNIGKNLSETLKYLIDRSDLVVLLIGARAGTKSESGQTWTKKEFDYASKKGKRVFAYIREVPSELISLSDREKDGELAIRALIDAVQKRIALVPRYKLGECCRLTAMVTRDVTRYVEELKGADERKTYTDSFVE